MVIQVCPFCADADDVHRVPLGPGAWRYTCENSTRHPAGSSYEWDATTEAEVRDGEIGGLAAEIGLAEDLKMCVVPGEPWVEYGVVEHRYSELNPAAYGTLVQKFGHTRIAPKSYTASVYISLTLGRIFKAGDICWQRGKGIGYWRYNSDISCWAASPAPPADAVLTYYDFALSAGLDPMA
ncbi:hypothetical protein ACL02T_34260 [Pseudonocardia sp. RS010]|uniref:hypothetical protein n=1 Tax=Pseudonocardia sp. RS010 TaxID=3385979 RepID=UPI0039A1E21E